MEKQVGTIYKVAGPLIVATGMRDVQMYDVVRVSEKKLLGESAQDNEYDDGGRYIAY